MIKPFRISLYEPFLRDFPESFRKATPQRWLINHVGERDLVEVECVYPRAPETPVHYLADQITGTLYSQASGYCLSSSRLRLLKPVASVARKKKAPFKPVPMRVIA